MLHSPVTDDCVNTKSAHRKFSKGQEVEASNGMGNKRGISLPEPIGGSGERHKIPSGVNRSPTRK